MFSRKPNNKGPYRTTTLCHYASNLETSHTVQILLLLFNYLLHENYLVRAKKFQCLSMNSDIYIDKISIISELWLDLQTIVTI